MSSTGSADNRKPKACISHMHWLVYRVKECEREAEWQKRRSRVHNLISFKSKNTRILRLWGKKLKIKTLTLWICLISTSCIRQGKENKINLPVKWAWKFECLAESNFFIFLFVWTFFFYLRHSNYVRGIRGQVVFAFSANFLQGRHTWHRQVRITQRLQHQWQHTAQHYRVIG